MSKSNGGLGIKQQEYLWLHSAEGCVSELGSGGEDEKQDLQGESDLPISLLGFLPDSYS